MARKQYDLTDSSVSPLKIILQISWPLFLEQILSTLVSYADTAMVGALGPHATASVSISNSFVFLLNGVVLALGTGLTAYIARSVGAKDFEAAKAYIRHSILILLMFGLPVVGVCVIFHRQIPLWMGAESDILSDAADYVLITSAFRLFIMAMMVFGSVLRGRGDTKTPLKINIIVNVMNIVGNYLLINPTHQVKILGLEFWIAGAGMGVQGAALSTGISWLFGGTALALMLFVKDDPTRISFHDSFRPDFPLLGRVIKLSVPAMFERMCMSLSGIVVTRSIASLGTKVIAANTVYLTAESISYMPAFAFATAATTLVGQALGAKKPELAKKYTRLTNTIAAVIMSIAGLGLFLFARQLASIFTYDEEVIKISMDCLHIVAFIQPIQAMAWIYAGALRGAGDTKGPFVITAVCTWLIRTLGAYVVIRFLHMGLPAAVVCMITDSFARAVWTGLRFRRGKWIKEI